MRFPFVLSAAGLCLALSQTALLGAPVPPVKPAFYPNWWFERDVIQRLPPYVNLSSSTNPPLTWPDHYPVRDDYAVANTGQLKYIATKAALELEERLGYVGGQGSAITNLLAQWGPQNQTGRDDFVAINLGQLKAVSSLFYDRLHDIGYGSPTLLPFGEYPWSRPQPDTSPPFPAADDYAVVNVGQLKYIFSFRVPGGTGDAADTDADGLPDAWELQYFGSISTESEFEDADGDGVNNRSEWLLGTNPVAPCELVSTSIAGLQVFSP